MKINKLCSIMMMLILALGTATVATSCGNDENIPQNQRNAIVINGVSSDIIEAKITLEDNISQIHLFTYTSDIEIKFRASVIPVGKDVVSYHVELEQDSKIVDDGPYKLSIAVDDDGIYTVDFPESKGSCDGKETKFSVYYKGKFTVSDQRRTSHGSL